MKRYLVVFYDSGNCDIHGFELAAYTFEHALAKARAKYTDRGLPVADIARVRIEVYQ